MTIVSSLKHKNTQPLYIFSIENPKNSEPQNGPRRGLDFIALPDSMVSDKVSFWKQHNCKNLHSDDFLLILACLNAFIFYVYWTNIINLGSILDMNVVNVLMLLALKFSTLAFSYGSQRWLLIWKVGSMPCLFPSKTCFYFEQFWRIIFQVIC